MIQTHTNKKALAGISARLCLAAAALAVVGCNDLSQIWEIDRPRVIAVQLTDPALQAGESAEVRLLVGDADGSIAEVSPTLITTEGIGLEPEVLAALSLAPAAGGWTVTANDQATIDAARAARALTDDQPLDVQFAVLVTVGGKDLVALKTVRLGADGANPPVPTILVDGETASPAALVVDVEAALTLDGLPPPPADPATAPDEEVLELSWLTSTGDLTESKTRTAALTVDAEAEPAGVVVAVVRNALGGVSWASIEIEVGAAAGQ